MQVLSVNRTNRLEIVGQDRNLILDGVLFVELRCCKLNLQNGSPSFQVSIGFQIGS